MSERSYTVQHLQDLTHHLDSEGVISQNEIDDKWRWVYHEVLREQGVPYSALFHKNGPPDVPKTTVLGYKASAKLKEMARWAKERGSKAELPD